MKRAFIFQLLREVRYLGAPQVLGPTNEVVIRVWKPLRKLLHCAARRYQKLIYARCQASALGVGAPAPRTS
eukprot:3473396-Pyramimonas_sp.AAC.1